MPKIETPGMFRERIAENFIVGETGHLAFQEGGKERIDSMIEERDAAIRAESAELLRVCGEELKAAKGWNETAQETLNPDRDIHCDDQAWVQIEQANNRIDTALAALKDAGCVNKTLKNEQETPHA